MIEKSKQSESVFSRDCVMESGIVTIPGVFKNVEMWHMGMVFSGEDGSAGLRVGLDLRLAF